MIQVEIRYTLKRLRIVRYTTPRRFEWLMMTDYIKAAKGNYP
jgi:hypothetical protein